MRSSSLCFSSLVLAALVVVPASGSAQPVQLPGITVEGATLEAPRAARALSAPGPAGTAPTASEAPSEEASGVRRDMIGTAVTVVTGEELRARQIQIGRAHV